MLQFKHYISKYIVMHSVLHESILMEEFEFFCSRSRIVVRLVIWVLTQDLAGKKARKL